MRILGHLDKGYIPGELDATLSDGRVVGPLESASARDRFMQLFGKSGSRLYSAEQLWSGYVGGEEYYLLTGSEWSMETCSFPEIYGPLIDDDNGHVVLDMPSSVKAVSGDTLILVQDPYTESPQTPRKRLPTPIKAPKLINLKDPRSDIIDVQSSHFHGEIVVARFPQTSGYIVSWRHDQRQTRDLIGISVHSNRQIASDFARKCAASYEPREPKRKNRVADTQKSRLYAWESSLDLSIVQFDTIDEARHYGAAICADLGVKPPKIELGRATLTTRSYIKGGTIRLSKDMLDNMTVTHEVAHHIADKICLRTKQKEPGHGPIFAAVLISLYEKHLNADMNAAIDLAIERKVDVDLKVVELLQAKLGRSKPETGLLPSI